MNIAKRLLLFAALTAIAALHAAAQTFPSKPVRIISPFAPGGTVDVLCREIGTRMSAALGQQVIVENRAGGGGIIGAEAIARAAPDGYTVGMLATSHAGLPAAQKISFDPAKDFSFVTQVAVVPGLLSAHASLPVKSLQDLLALARARPGQLNYGHPGNLSAGHLAMELLKIRAGVDIVPVAYKGGGPAMIDLLGGQVQLMISGPTAHLPHIKSGKLRGIVTTGSRRSSGVPDVPTVAESGLPGFEVNEWYGMVAPAGVPPEIMARLNAEMVKAIQSPELHARMTGLGAEPVGNKPEEFRSFFLGEMDKLGKLIRQLGLKAD